MAPTLKVGVVHASSVFMDNAKTIEKILAFIQDGSDKGLDLLVFPECFLPAFPSYSSSTQPSSKLMPDPSIIQFWSNCYSPVVYSRVIPDYIRQSIRMDGPEVAIISAACQKAKLAIVLGVSERAPDGTGTIFNSQFFFDKDGTLLGSHRKTQPTFSERTIWAQGSGYTVRTFAMQDGYNLGGLVCWEHTMNLAKYSLAEQCIQVHAAAWPSYSTLQDGFDRGCADNQIESLMLSHAFTAQTFVLAASCPVDETALEYMESKLGPQNTIEIGGGWSGIVHPHCKIIAGPVKGHGDKLLTAEIKLDDILALSGWLDSAGHYGRPEVFQLKVNDSPTWCYDEASIHPTQPKSAFGAPKRLPEPIKHKANGHTAP